MSIRTNIIKIGNSQGVRIPKPLLEQSGLGKTVEIDVEPNRIVIRSIRRPRQGWEEEFTRMAEAGDDALLDPETPTEWDKSEWTWPDQT